MPLRFAAALPTLKTELDWINGGIDLNALEGKPIVVHFWSISCAFCFFSTPKMRVWSEMLKPSGLVILSIHLPKTDEQRSVETVQASADEQGMIWPCALDNEQLLADRFQVSGAIPHYFFFDRQHKMRARAAGMQGSELLQTSLWRYFGWSDEVLSETPHESSPETPRLHAH